MRKQVTIPLVEADSAEGIRLLKRITRARTARNRTVQRAVEEVLKDIKSEGNKALFRYTGKFDGIRLTSGTV